jgi:hypothetical protein
MNKFCRLLAPALETYACATGHGDPALDESVVADLLADLRHWCDQSGWNFDALDRQGYNHYLRELSTITPAPADAGDTQ